jgi:hypothetical protein
MLKNLQKELQSLGSYVVQESRKNLTKGGYKNKGHNVTRGLFNSIGYDEENKNGVYSIEWFMDEYGTFLDKGVKGTKSNYIENKNSPYSYKNKKPPMQPLADWAKKRNIRLRDKEGKFKKGNYRTIGFILQRSIFEKGIRPSFFFTKAFNSAFKKYPELLSKAFAQDIIDILKDNNNE